MEQNGTLRLRDLGRPDSDWTGRLLSLQERLAELEVAGAPQAPPGALVEFETGGILYLGTVEASQMRGEMTWLRVGVEHSLDLAAARTIQEGWSEVPR